MMRMSRRTAVVSRTFGAFLALALATTACGGDQRGAADTTAAATVATTTEATTPPTTTVAATTTLAPSTTEATTTTTEATLPVPAAAPDPHAPDPIVQVGTIEIPAIGVTKKMFEGVSLTVLDHGPGHWPGTAQPGQRGNVVVAGHRTSHDRPFRNVDKLRGGDQVIFTTEAGRFVYAVTSIEVVQPDAIWIIDQTDDHTATLFACHPPGSTRQRIVVHLRLVS